MHESPTESAHASPARQLAPLAGPKDSLTARRPRLRLGIGSRLALSVALIAGVILVGHVLARRTTLNAVAAVRSMQTEQEPRARSASAVVDKLVAYDRTVTEYLQSSKGPGFEGISAAGGELDAAVSNYFGQRAASVPAPADIELRTQLSSHVDRGRDIAKNATQRATWV